MFYQLNDNLNLMKLLDDLDRVKIKPPLNSKQKQLKEYIEE